MYERKAMIGKNFVVNIIMIMCNIFNQIYKNIIGIFRLLRGYIVSLSFRNDIYNGNFASCLCNGLVQKIDNFEKNFMLEVNDCNKYVLYGNEPVIVEKISYQNPDMIIFSGTTADGGAVQIIQHISQLNLLLIATPRRNNEEQSRKIGFL